MSNQSGGGGDIGKTREHSLLSVLSLFFFLLSRLTRKFARKDVPDSIDAESGGEGDESERAREGRTEEKSGNERSCRVRSGSSEFSARYPTRRGARATDTIMAGREARGLELRVSPRGQRTGVAFFRNTRHTDRNFSRRSTDARSLPLLFFFFFLLFFPSFLLLLSLSLSRPTTDILFATYAFSRFLSPASSLFLHPRSLARCESLACVKFRKTPVCSRMRFTFLSFLSAG